MLWDETTGVSVYDARIYSWIAFLTSVWQRPTFTDRNRSEPAHSLLFYWCRRLSNGIGNQVENSLGDSQKLQYNRHAKKASVRVGDWAMVYMPSSVQGKERKLARHLIKCSRWLQLMWKYHWSTTHEIPLFLCHSAEFVAAMMRWMTILGQDQEWSGSEGGEPVYKSLLSPLSKLMKKYFLWPLSCHPCGSRCILDLSPGLWPEPMILCPN